MFRHKIQLQKYTRGTEFALRGSKELLVHLNSPEETRTSISDIAQPSATLGRGYIHCLRPGPQRQLR